MRTVEPLLRLRELAANDAEVQSAEANNYSPVGVLKNAALTGHGVCARSTLRLSVAVVVQFRVRVLAQLPT
jgi:hypothetical protein